MASYSGSDDTDYGESTDYSGSSNTTTNTTADSGNSWLDSLSDSVKNIFTKTDAAGNTSWNTGLLSLLSSGAINLLGLGGSKVPPTGYQGGIPTYKAVRERVPFTYDPNRRPGSGGQRYFSDLGYLSPDNAAAAQTAAQQQAGDLAYQNFINLARQQRPMVQAAAGGLMSHPASQGYYLGGKTDGMADKVPARIGNDQPAALSDGEFVVPADVVSHLGNGNSNAGADQLYAMMDRIRKARTGTQKQGKQINPAQYMPR